MSDVQVDSGAAKIEELRDKGSQVFMDLVKQLIPNAKDVPRIAVEVFLAAESVSHFGRSDMWWYGPLALELSLAPSGATGSTSVSLFGVDVDLPSSQNIGIAMLTVLGVLNGLDFAAKVAEAIVKEFDKYYSRELGIPAFLRVVPSNPRLGYGIHCPVCDWFEEGKYLSMLALDYKNHYKGVHQSKP